MHMPDAHDRYQRLLIAALNASGVSSGLEVQLTRSATVDLLLAPLRLGLFRWRGTRIIHLHYLFKYSVRWANGALPRRMLRWWFGVWLHATRVLGLRLVWTAHNILPHEPIFDDDESARRMLIRRADALIALSEFGRRELRSRFAADVAAVIPPGVTLVGPPLQGHTAPANAGGEATRTTVTFVGRVNRYKGVDLLLAAVAVSIPDLSVRIAGECCERAYARELTAAARQAQAAGVDVVLELTRLTDEEYAAACR
jgi:glycosyltransferase involved in cell wall biosynthesis